MSPAAQLESNAAKMVADFARLFKEHLKKVYHSTSPKGDTGDAKEIIGWLISEGLDPKAMVEEFRKRVVRYLRAKRDEHDFRYLKWGWNNYAVDGPDVDNEFVPEYLSFEENDRRQGLDDDYHARIKGWDTEARAAISAWYDGGCKGPSPRVIAVKPPRLPEEEYDYQQKDQTKGAP